MDPTIDFDFLTYLAEILAARIITKYILGWLPKLRRHRQPPTNTLPSPTPTSADQSFYLPPTQYTSLPPVPPPANLIPFQRAQIEYARLGGELAAGRITTQQYEGAVNAMTVQDQYGHFWTMGAADGLWYVYDGYLWLRANPS